MGNNEKTKKYELCYSDNVKWTDLKDLSEYTNCMLFVIRLGKLCKMQIPSWKQIVALFDKWEGSNRWEPHWTHFKQYATVKWGSGAKYDKKSAKYYEDDYNAHLQTEENDINDVLMGGCENEDDSKSDDTDTQIAMNGAIKLSKRNKLGRHQHLSPCLILSKPDKQQSKFHIQMAAPFESDEYWVHPQQFKVVSRDDNEAYVNKVEQAWIEYYQQQLGYDSIEQQYATVKWE